MAASTSPPFASSYWYFGGPDGPKSLRLGPDLAGQAALAAPGIEEARAPVLDLLDDAQSVVNCGAVPILAACGPGPSKRSVGLKFWTQIRAGCTGEDGAAAAVARRAGSARSGS